MPPHDRSEAYPDEITLADLLEIIWRRRRLGIMVAVVVLVGVVLFTGMTPATYEATATLLPVNERDEIFAVMQSRAFAADVADELGLTARLGNQDRAVADLQERVQVTKGSGRIGDRDQTIITIRVESGTATGAARTANAYMATLETWQEYLHEITWGKKWESYYEDAGKNAEQATQELNALLLNQTYWQPLDQATPPEGALSPDWHSNLALGGTLAVVLGVLSVFGVEGGMNALTELKKRRDSSRKER